MLFTKTSIYRGEVFAMAGGTLSHALIASNAGAALKLALRAKDCITLNSDMRLGIPSTTLYTYPDVQVVCGKPELGPHDTLLNPTLIVEVLSDSTKDHDLGTRFECYRRIVSLREYITISQAERRVQHWTRQPDNTWRLVEHTEGNIPLALDVTVTVDDFYGQVEF